MKQFIYLIQGRSDLLENFKKLEIRKDIDVLFLSYDKPFKDGIYFPGSTWSQGRNRLFKEALLLDDYEYYIFCDDDIKFSTGNWQLFESHLMKHKPAIGVPVFGKTKDIFIEELQYQLFTVNDEQLIAFHKNTIQEGIVLPYYSRFDKIHWWASCEIQEILIQNFYFEKSLQFNLIEVLNIVNTRYTNKTKNIERYKRIIRNWLAPQFKKELCEIVFPYRKNTSSDFKTYLFSMTLQYRTKRNTNCIGENIINNLLHADSPIYQRHLDIKKKGLIEFMSSY